MLLLFIKKCEMIQIYNYNYNNKQTDHHFKTINLNKNLTLDRFPANTLRCVLSITKHKCQALNVIKYFIYYCK